MKKLDYGPHLRFRCTNYLFFIYFSRFFKYICPFLNFANLYHYRRMTWCMGPTTIWYGGWRCYNVPSAISRGARYYSTCKRRVPQQLGSIRFKKIITFCMNSDGDKLYMKIIAFDEIYNFVVQTF
jgi:hypothetical protein